MSFIPTPNPSDINSYSNFDKILQKSFDISVTVDLENKHMSGTVTTVFQILDENEDKIVLDLNGPEILKVEILPSNDLEGKGREIKYEIWEENEFKEALGTPLIVSLRSLGEGEKNKFLLNNQVTLRISFKTNENCDGIQFLDKAQTYTKKFPFMFTQCEPILCRSLFPCQDTPGAKVTVRAKCRSVRDVTVVFGGIFLGSKYDSNTKLNTYYYEQKVPIPSYLIAFAAGELEYERISDRCGVYAEKGLAKKGKYEFEDTEKYIQIAEEYLDCPYLWQKYDLLILPFSFPYGGMENPNLTFVTPSLLAGDKSMSNVIGHEISHSWTGNLVTNKNWGNFWVNEGFTTFMERKLDGALLGEEMEKLEAIVGYHELINDIKLIGTDSEYTKLSPDFSNVNPDDGFSTVPYEKGYNFLLKLETLIGKEHFRNVMRNYIKKYQYQSVDYTAFKLEFEEYIRNNLNDGEEVVKSVDWDEALYSKGVPKEKFNVTSTYTEEIDQMLSDYLKGENKIKNKLDVFKTWHTNVKLVFLNNLMKKAKKLGFVNLMKIKENLGLAEQYNDEVKYMWYIIEIKNDMAMHNSDELRNIKGFLQTRGRLKYIRPVYQALKSVNGKVAKEIFERCKNMYHPFARRMIQEMLNREDANEEEKSEKSGGNEQIKTEEGINSPEQSNIKINQNQDLIEHALESGEKLKEFDPENIEGKEAEIYADEMNMNSENKDGGIGNEELEHNLNEEYEMKEVEKDNDTNDENNCGNEVNYNDNENNDNIANENNVNDVNDVNVDAYNLTDENNEGNEEGAENYDEKDLGMYNLPKQYESNEGNGGENDRRESCVDEGGDGNVEYNEDVPNMENAYLEANQQEDNDEK